MYLQMHAVQCINVFGNKSMLNESLGTDGNLYDPWQHGEPLAEQRPQHEEQRVEDVERADGDEHDEEERVVAVLQGDDSIALNIWSVHPSTFKSNVSNQKNIPG